MTNDSNQVKVKRKRYKPGEPRPKRGNPNFASVGNRFKPDDPTTGFKDPRINRKGYIKPKSQRQLEALLDELFKEEVDVPLRMVNEKGQTILVPDKMTRLEYMLLHMLDAGDSRDRSEILNRRFGKQKESDLNGDVEVKGAFSIPAELVAPDFTQVLRDIIDQMHMEYLLKGGRGSTKSSFVALVIIYLLKKYPQGHALIMRQVAVTLRGSVFNKMLWAIRELGLENEFKPTTSPLEITLLATGQKIYFMGADDPGKTKSITVPFGYIMILWLEELDQFKGPEAVRKIEQSVVRGGEVSFIFKTYNPPPTTLNWVNKYSLVPKANQYQHSSNYLGLPPAYIEQYEEEERDGRPHAIDLKMATLLFKSSAVPVTWLGKPWLDEAEHLLNTNKKAYKHEYLGIITGLGTNVFENIVLRAITDEEIAQFDHVLDGLDWGYYPDPAEYGKCHYDAARHSLYIFTEVRKWKTGNKKLYELIKKEGGYRDQDLLIADSAEPKSVGDFRAYGANCRGAEKGPDSVEYSMKWLQSLSAIYIDPVRCPYAADEFVNYQHELTKDGEVISGYPDKNNHSIDRVRYATNLIWREKGK